MGPVRGWRVSAAPVACAVVLFVILLVLAGQSGFAHAEGQRALPAWEMLVSGDFFVPRLFGQACLRKPPGVPWLIALASVVFGHTHFAARVVSIGSMLFASVCSAYFARRWFHRPGVGTLAGLTMCLFPLWYWYPPVAPSAEIEAPFVACTLLTTLLMLDTLCGAWRLRCVQMVCMATLTTGPSG